MKTLFFQAKLIVDFFVPRSLSLAQVCFQVQRAFQSELSKATARNQLPLVSLNCLLYGNLVEVFQFYSCSLGTIECISAKSGCISIDDGTVCP
jgi:hypothetical protein